MVPRYLYPDVLDCDGRPVVDGGVLCLEDYLCIVKSGDGFGILHGHAGVNGVQRILGGSKRQYIRGGVPNCYRLLMCEVGG